MMIKAEIMLLPYMYNGYRGCAIYDDSNKVWYGKLLNSGVDLVPYEAETYDGLQIAFQKAIDDYLVFLNNLEKNNKGGEND